MSDYKTQLTKAELEQNFAEIAPPLEARAASIEAERCLYCYDAPCMRACPTHIDVPKFIKQIATHDTRGAAKTILSENILGGSCGRACPTSVLCEGACVLNDVNEKPIQIGQLQRFATDFVHEENIQFWKKGPDSGKSIAIVGAGPAGLSCAYELTKLGHNCVVYEAAPLPGGLNTYGVAGYKISTEDALKEVDYIKQIGIEIVCGVRIGTDRSIQDLLDEFDAVFLGIGLGSTAQLGIEGEDLEGCVEALDFIRPTRDLQYEDCQVGQRVVVLGAGNTAIDCSTAAVRMGAESVKIVYRRTAAEMPAYDFEFEHAKFDGVEFVWLSAPTRIVGAAGKVTGVECLKQKLIPSENGRAQLEAIPGSEYVIPCEMVVKALGQNPITELIESIPDLKTDRGKIIIDESDCATSIPGLYAGGDCSNGGAEVVNAVENGKVAAASINTFLSQYLNREAV